MIDMITIYCIEDCNSLKYVGSTKQKIKDRLIQHKYKKKINNYCSSSNLNLENCKIYSLESCNECDRIQREKYWINKIDCVNKYKLNGENKERSKQRKKLYHNSNIEYFTQYKKDYNLFVSKKVVNGCYEFIKMLEQY